MPHADAGDSGVKPIGDHDATTPQKDATADVFAPTDATVATDTGPIGDLDAHIDVATDVVVPEDANTGDANTDDASDAGTDSAADDAQVDAGTDAGNATGDPCGPVNKIEHQKCGLCGTQDRVCLPNDPTATGGVAVWQPWGFCHDQPQNACQPGTSTTEACGLCGHRQKICQNNCQYAVSACQGEPVDACTPGDKNYVSGLSCDAGGRTQTCTAQCSWGSFGPCEGTGGAVTLTISGVVGNVVTLAANMPKTPTLGRLGTSSNCSATSVTISTTKTAYNYTVVTNPTAQVAKVSIWGSKAPTGEDIDTIMTVYNGDQIPTTDAQRKACTSGVIDGCTSDVDTACDMSWAGLMSDNSHPITIPAGGSVVAYTAAWYDDTSTSPHDGKFLLNVKTEALQ